MQKNSRCWITDLWPKGRLSAFRDPETGSLKLGKVRGHVTDKDGRVVGVNVVFWGCWKATAVDWLALNQLIAENMAPKQRRPSFAANGNGRRMTKAEMIDRFVAEVLK